MHASVQQYGSPNVPLTCCVSSSARSFVQTCLTFIRSPVIMQRVIDPVFARHDRQPIMFRPPRPWSRGRGGQASVSRGPAVAGRHGTLGDSGRVTRPLAAAAHTGWNQRLCDTDGGPLPCEREYATAAPFRLQQREDVSEGSRLGQGRAGKSIWTGIWTWNPSAGPRAKVRGTRGPGPLPAVGLPNSGAWPHMDGLLFCCLPLLVCSLHMIGVFSREVTDSPCTHLTRDW
jgi:hypothetical protein